jgi:hypothetical protein
MTIYFVSSVVRPNGHDINSADAKDFSICHLDSDSSHCGLVAGSSIGPACDPGGIGI